MMSFYQQSNQFINPGLAVQIRAYITNSCFSGCVWTAGLILLSAWWIGTDWSAALVASTVLLVLIAYRSFEQQSYIRQHRQLFLSEKQAIRVLTQASTTFRKLGGRTAGYALQQGLKNIPRQLGAITISSPMRLSQLGTNLSKAGILPGTDDEALYIVVWAGLVEWLHMRTHEDTPDATRPGEFSLLPAPAQDYILTFMPNLVRVNPLRFDAAHLDAMRLGLGTVVLGLKSLHCAFDDVVQSANDWLDTPPVTRETTFPNNLMLMR